ncbi:MAG TPA: sulfatase-like hydrolase/transferase [Patescibacteria group bacterium]|nr:sulfatase-like hydrolase/transferase [Patescibacteria group bacterium]
MVVCDTVRADHVSGDGYARPTTPEIDALGRDGAVYLDAYTPSPWTLPAHASLFTGLYPSSHGADSGHLQLDPSLPLLARRLHDAGYRTLAYVENPWVGKEYGFDAGFDTFDEIWRGVRGTEEDMGAARVSKAVESWLAWRDDNPDARRQPFFIFINYFEAHLPYNPPAEERSKFLRPAAGMSAADRDARVERLRRFKHPEEVKQILGVGSLEPADFAILSDLYDGEIAYVDRHVGEVAGLLRRRGLLDRTVVAVTSDHGEMLGEHGLMDHKLNLYEPVLRVPMVLRYPPAIAPGLRVESPVMLQDLYPTLLSLAGVDQGAPPAPAEGVRIQVFPPESRVLPGVTGLTPGPIRGASVEDPLIAEYAHPGEFLDAMKEVAQGADLARWSRSLVAFRAAGEKLIWASDGRNELYDLASDPSESAQVDPTDPDARHLAAHVEYWLSRPTTKPGFRPQDKH